MPKPRRGKRRTEPQRFENHAGLPRRYYVTMLRGALNLLTAVSLLLCCGAVGGWVHSYSAAETFRHTRVDLAGDMTFKVRDELRVACGEMTFTHTLNTGRGGRYRAGVVDSVKREAKARGRFHESGRPAPLVHTGVKGVSFAGFNFARASYVRADGTVCLAYHRATLPMWSPVALTATLPALRLVGLCRTRRRVARGRCRACNYDLRATPGRCPECGTPSRAAVETPVIPADGPPPVFAPRPQPA